MTPTASWLMVGGIVVAAIAFVLAVAWFVGDEEWHDQRR